jgi:streptogramin lyase
MMPNNFASIAKKITGAGDIPLLWTAGASLFLLAALPLTSSAQVSFAEFPVPTPSTAPAGITAGPDGAVWFAENGPGSAGGIGRIDVNGVFTEYPLPEFLANGRPQQIVTGPDGLIYFTAMSGDYIGQLRPSSGAFTGFSIPNPTANAVPFGIAAESDGGIWFTEAPVGAGATTKIGCVTMTTSALSDYSAGLTAGSQPLGITPGPTGSNTLYFTEFSNNRIGIVTAAAPVGNDFNVCFGVSIEEFPATLTANANPFGIVYNPGDGNLWFTEQGVGQIGVMSPSGTLLHEYATDSTTSKPTSITVGADGALWFTEEGSNEIGRIDASGARSYFPIPTPSSGPHGIAVGSDGALWFTESLANKIGRISEIAFESLQLVPGSLTQLSIGADGSVWGINEFQQIYTYNFGTAATPASWTNIPGSLKTIAAGNANAVWGINDVNQIYRYDTATGGWVNVPGELNQIAVGGDGSAWGINSLGNIYYYNGSGWTQVLGTLSTNPGSIAVGSAGAVYGLNDNGSIYWYNPGLGRFTWFTGTVGYTQIAVGIDGDLWAVSGSTAYHWDVLHKAFAATAGASIHQLAVGAGSAVFGLDSSRNVFQWNATSQVWVPISGNLSDIAAGANGSVWGVNSSQQIFQLLGAPTRQYQTLTAIPGASLDQISVGADGTVWGVSSNTVEFFNPGTQTFQAVAGSPLMTQVSVGAGNDVWGVYCSTSTADNCTVYEYLAGTTPTWQLISGELNNVQVAADGQVWGINAAGSTYYYDFNTSSWVQIPGALGTLSVGADGTVWGIDGQSQVYRYAGRTDGTVGAWENVPGSLSEISVGSANNVWGVKAEGQIYTYQNGWVPIGGELNEVWATFDGAVWGINTSGSLYRWNGSSFNFVSNGVNGVSQVVLGNASNVWATYAGSTDTSPAVYMWF